jgi:hypothetical protein
MHAARQKEDDILGEEVRGNVVKVSDSAHLNGLLGFAHRRVSISIRITSV